MAYQKGDYQQRINDANLRLYNLSTEMSDHLTALRDMDTQTALESLDLIEQDAREMRYYIERIAALIRLRDSHAR